MRRIRLLITGVAGFIGRSLVEEIVRRALPIDISGIDIRVPQFADPDYLRHVDFAIVDIRDRSAIDTYLCHRQFDGVVHLAAVSRVVEAEQDKQNCVAVNLSGTQMLVERLAASRDTWLLFASSREVYGEQQQLPVSESADKRPVNIYGECKLMAEQVVKAHIRRYAILRFCNVYGNSYDIPGRVIPNFVSRAINNQPICIEGGEQVIDFTHITDTVDCILQTINLLCSGEIDTCEMHISPGVPNKITDVIDCLQDLLNRPLPTITCPKRDFDVQRFVGNNAHREQVLGKKRFLTLRQGIEGMVRSLAEQTQV